MKDKERGRTALLVRPYEATDREAVHRIAADTAFFGDPIERYLDDRQHFLDLFLRAGCSAPVRRRTSTASPPKRWGS